MVVLVTCKNKEEQMKKVIKQCLLDTPRTVRTEQNIYFIDLNSTVSRHTYFDITKDSYMVTMDVYMDSTTK